MLKEWFLVTCLLLWISIYLVSVVAHIYRLYASIVYLSSDEERGFVHLKILQQNGGYVLGQYSHTFRTIPECIAYYCEHKLNIKDSVHQSLKKPVLRCW